MDFTLPTRIYKLYTVCICTYICMYKDISVQQYLQILKPIYADLF